MVEQGGTAKAGVSYTKESEITTDYDILPLGPLFARIPDQKTSSYPVKVLADASVMIRCLQKKNDQLYPTINYVDSVFSHKTVIT